MQFKMKRFFDWPSSFSSPWRRWSSLHYLAKSVSVFSSNDTWSSVMKENVLSSVGLYDEHHFLPSTLKRRIVVIICGVFSW